MAKHLTTARQSRIGKQCYFTHKNRERTIIVLYTKT